MAKTIDDSERLARMTAVVADIESHISAWTGLLEAHIAALSPDRSPSGHDGDEGSSERGYAEHELRAMRRDLGALVQL